MEMKNRKDPAMLPRKALCVALATAFTGPAVAEGDDEVARLVKPESHFSLGAGTVSTDNQRFGTYNGLNREGTFGIIDFSVVRRDDDTGTWLRAQGRNLGLDTREFRVEHERQGSWGYFIDFSQIPRVTPYDVRTNVLGLDSANQTVPPAPGLATGATGSHTFRTDRQLSKLGFNKTLLPELEFKVVFQNEEKEGKRLFGRGNGSVQEFLAEPIRSTTRQFDAVLDYTGDRLQLSGGYYGSFYNNHHPYLHVNNGNATFAVANNSTGVAMDNIALPPDNAAHQLHLAGGYRFTNATRANFKVSRSVALQNDAFMPVVFGNTGASANTSGRTDLGGRVDTTLVQIGITSRPLPNLSLLGNLRYEDRDDNTRVARYITTVGGTGAAPVLSALAGTSTTDGFNEPRSLTNKSGKVEASYQLPQGFRLTGGLDVEQKERSMAGVRVVGYREKTDETTWRLEARRTMAESLTGSVAYLHSDRTGSSYRNLVTLNGVNPYPNYNAALTADRVSRNGLLQPIYIADRERDRVRLALDWAPTDALSAQFMFEDARDDYGRGRGNPDIGVRKGGGRLYSVDVSYQLTDAWKLTGWAARSENQIDQATIASTANPMTNASMTLWSSEMRNTVDSFALGMRGRLLSGKLDVGADYILAHDLSTYRLAKLNTGPAAVNSLPDITYRHATIKLFGKYAVNKDMAVRLDYLFNQYRTNDWTWDGWTYSDGTRIARNAQDRVHVIGLSMNYAFR